MEKKRFALPLLHNLTYFLVNQPNRKVALEVEQIKKCVEKKKT